MAWWRLRDNPGIKVPIVVRLRGTNVELGQKILTESGLNFVVANE